MSRKCRFQDVWLEDEKYKLWLKIGKDAYTGFCSLCKKQIDVSHSGVNALTSHRPIKGKKHSAFENNLRSGKQLTIFSYRPKSSTSIVAAALRPKPSCSVAGDGPRSLSSCDPNLLSVRPSCSNIEPSGSVPNSSVVEFIRPISESSAAKNSLLLEPSPRISSFLLNDSVTKSEILWSLFCVMSHTSNRSGGIATDLFPVMFPDSPIANRMQLHKDKIAYSITYGLGPCFSDLVSANARRSPFYALSIDESLNEICQKSQMDIMINYWSDEKSSVCTSYLSSMFLEKSSAVDLLDSVMTCIGEKNLPLENLIQLSTDGPNVNLKLIFDLKSHMRNNLTSGKELVDVGTCSLHIVNGAYKTAHTKVGWKVNEFLRALYRLFKNYPSRRSVYCQLTGSSVFPKKFCSVRWTENSGVIRRALDILKYLKKYVTEVTEPPATDNFVTVKNFLLNDPALEAKLHFSAMIAEELEEFLTYFQRNDPLLPFLHGEVFSLMKSLGGRFIKKTVIEAAKTSSKLKKIDITKDENLLFHNSVDVGFGARACLKKMKDRDCQEFQRDCKKFLLEMYTKLLEKSPLNKRFVLGATCLDPTVMFNETLSIFRVKIAIEELVAHSQISSAEGDVVMREYKKFVADPLVREKFQSFNWKRNDRLDLKFGEIFDLKPDEVNNQLKLFIKIILLCFHGNASVERSFSFNKNFLVENLHEQSLVAQRAVHDYIISLSGGLSSLTITKKMILDYRNASARRKEALKSKKDKEDEAVFARKRATQQLKELKQKKLKLLEEQSEQLSAIEAQMKSLHKAL